MKGARSLTTIDFECFVVRVIHYSSEETIRLCTLTNERVNLGCTRDMGTGSKKCVSVVSAVTIIFIPIVNH